MLGCWDITIWKKCVFGDVALIIPHRLYVGITEVMSKFTFPVEVPDICEWIGTVNIDCEMHEYEIEILKKFGEQEW